jgi:4-carboxymuconolactone decarboxylase
MLIAMGKTEELRFHFPSAVRNGVSLEEIEEIIYQASGYCGFPAAASARKVAEESITKAGLFKQ